MGSKPKYDENVRKIRKLSNKYILALLSKKPLTSKEIIKKVKEKFPKYCDDEVICICESGGRTKEWQHQVRWAINDIKYNKKIKFNKNTKKYSNLDT